MKRVDCSHWLQVCFSIAMVLPSPAIAANVFTKIAATLADPYGSGQPRVLLVPGTVCLTQPACNQVLRLPAEDAEADLVNNVEKAFRSRSRSGDHIEWVYYDAETHDPKTRDELNDIAQRATDDSCGYILHFSSHAYYQWIPRGAPAAYGKYVLERTDWSLRLENAGDHTSTVVRGSEGLYDLFPPELNVGCP